MSDFSDYSSTTLLYEVGVPDVTPYNESLGHFEVGNIIINEDGTVEITTTNTVSEVIGTVDSIDMSVYKPSIPMFIFDNCFIYKGFVNYQPSIVRFDIEWSPINEASHYKVFWLINVSSSVSLTDIDTDNLLSYTNGPFFSGESEIIPNIGTNAFSYKIPDDSTTVINKISIFIFSYIDTKRCDFPSFMITGILNDKKTQFPIEKIYLEKTTYEYSKDIYYTIEDDESDIGKTPNELNLKEKNIL